MLKDSDSRFGKISILNHWALALLILFLLGLGLYMEDLPPGPDKWEVYDLHKALGVAALFFGLWRVAWRLSQGFPTHPEGVLPWEQKASKLAHYALLVCVVIMPISGYVYSETAGHAVAFFGLFNMPALPDSEIVSSIAKSTHGFVANVLMVVILLHVAAALKHHFVNKDATLKRMLGR